MKKIAVLIPCYNEAATIADVVADYRDALRMRISTFLTTTRPMKRLKLHVGGGQMSAVNGVRGKEMSYERCFGISMLTAI